MGEWTELSLRESGVELIDCEHKTPQDDPSGEFLYVMIPQLRDGRIAVDSAKRISAADFTTWTRRATPSAGDVLLSRRTNPGETAVVPAGHGIAVGQNLVLLRTSNGAMARDYLRWIVRGPEWWGEVARHLNVGAVFDSLKCADIPNFRLTMPPIEEQRAIAAVLGAIDDKIEVNRRMAETLEEMARALFRSWFVDFDPVRAKTEGRDSGLPPEISDLFPDRLVDSPLGEIPDGWRVGDLYAITEVIYGAPFSSALFNSDEDGVPVIRIRDLGSQRPAVWTTEVHPRGRLIESGDLLVGMDGEFRSHLWSSRSAWLNQRVCCLDPRPGYSTAFVRGAVDPHLALLESTQIGTTVIHLGKKDIDRFRVVVPDTSVVSVFNRLAEPTTASLVACRLEIATLAELRDSLLPKLVSGEVRIGDPVGFLERLEAVG